MAGGQLLGAGGGRRTAGCGVRATDARPKVSCQRTNGSGTTLLHRCDPKPRLGDLRDREGERSAQRLALAFTQKPLSHIAGSKASNDERQIFGGAFWSAGRGPLPDELRRLASPGEI